MTRSRSLLLLAAACVCMLCAFAPSASAYDPAFSFATDVSTNISTTFGAGSRPLGVAAGDYDKDGDVDFVIGRGSTGHFFLSKNNGDGTFAAPTQFAWKQTTFNAWTINSGDVNGDGNLDVIWGANLDSGCTVTFTSPATCASAGGQPVVKAGEVRWFQGNGNGTFVLNNYNVSGISHNAGSLISRPFTPTSASVGGAGSLAAADVDADGDQDVVAGGIDGTHQKIQLLKNPGASGLWTTTTLVDEATTTAGQLGSTIYQPPLNVQNNPFGLAFGDADGNGTQDLFVGDRALYVYLFKNDGAGNLSLTQGDTVVSGTRPNVYLAHEGYRPSTGFTPSLAAGDVSGDGKADLVLGLLSGSQTAATSPAHDGELLLDVSSGSGHLFAGIIDDIGMMARGVRLVDWSGDGLRDIVSGEFDGRVRKLKQMPPADTDGDGVNEYKDNAPNDPNAARIDMNADGGVNFLDQLDNDFDTLLGNPEDTTTWQRKGDVADPDDDNDTVPDATDNCVYASNSGQANVDGDTAGDACDPLDNRNDDGDGVPTGPRSPSDPDYAATKAAAIKWSQGDTHFVIRIDALGRFFQNEFTQILTDAASLSPADWAAKCGQDYQPEIESSDPADPCGSPTTLDGGKGLPITLVVIPKQLWSDSPVVDWINDRNNSALLEIGQHGTYHVNNIPRGDWAGRTDVQFHSCDACGLTKAESLEYYRVGRDTLLGNYGNKWVAESGALAGSPKIDWNTSANKLISFAAPFNTSDQNARWALSQLGFKAFSASEHEENSSIFTPEGSHHEQFNDEGMFHASADAEVDPPDIATDDTYDEQGYHDELVANTQDGGLNTWLIEEVEWSGRECQYAARLTDCGGHENRENDRVFAPRWKAWMQLLDYVKNYEGGVAMTMGEVALAKAYDNAPTVDNAGQADSDHDGVGDVIDGATLTADDAAIVRNSAASTLSATLENGAGDPIAGQDVSFSFDADGDGTPETQTDSTDSDGVASVAVTATRGVASGLSYSVSWDGVRETATDTAAADVTDTTALTLSQSNPATGVIGDSVSVSGTLVDSDGDPLEGKTVQFSIGSDTASATTGSTGVASASITLTAPDGQRTVTGAFAGDTSYASSQDATGSMAVLKRGTNLLFAANTPTSGLLTDSVTFHASLIDSATGPMSGQSVTFTFGSQTATVNTGSTGDASATFTIQAPTGSQTLKVEFAGDSTFEGASDTKSFNVQSRATTLFFKSGTATSGDLTDNVTFQASLIDFATGTGVSGKSVTFTFGSATSTVSTNSSGEASATFAIQAPLGSRTLKVEYAGDGVYDPASDTTSFTVNKEATVMTMTDTVAPKKGKTPPAVATLKDSDTGGGGIAGKTVTFYALQRGQYKSYGTAVTGADGRASFTYPAAVYGTATAKTPIRAVWAGDATYTSVQADAFAYKQ